MYKDNTVKLRRFDTVSFYELMKKYEDKIYYFEKGKIILPKANIIAPKVITLNPPYFEINIPMQS